MKLFLIIYFWSAIVTTIYFFVKQKKEFGNVYLGELILWLLICLLFSQWGFILFDQFMTDDFEDEVQKPNTLIDWLQIILSFPFLIFYMIFLNERILDKFKLSAFYRIKIF